MFRRPVLAIGLAALATAAPAAAADTPDLRTVAEQSGYLRTGRYDEVQRLCAAFAAAWPKQVRHAPESVECLRSIHVR